MTKSNHSKRKIAVFYGCRTPEHDVSVVSALQVLSAIDPTRYDAFPVYIDPQGDFYVGDALRQRSNYLLSDQIKKQLTRVHLDLGPQKSGGRLVADPPKGFLRKDPEEFSFDVAFPVFHGVNGEDGSLPGVFDFAGIPYAGMRQMASTVLMDKLATKRIAQSLGIDVLPCSVFERPNQGLMIPEADIKKIVKAANISFPACLKPSHLGSSIGVARVESVDDIAACLPAIFKMDDVAILEPFVENLVEYNVSVSRIGDGQTKLSAIERPKGTDELLDFKQKYLSGGKSGDTKLAGAKSPAVSEGMLSLTRDINPKVPKEMAAKIEKWAHAIFDGVGGTGAPRIDFIANGKTKEIWMNEVNPCPGSLGYFLWEAAEDRLLFTDFLSQLIEEAWAISKTRKLPADPVPEDARLLRRP